MMGTMDMSHITKWAEEREAQLPSYAEALSYLVKTLRDALISHRHTLEYPYTSGYEFVGEHTTICKDLQTLVDCILVDKWPVGNPRSDTALRLSWEVVRDLFDAEVYTPYQFVRYLRQANDDYGHSPEPRRGAGVTLLSRYPLCIDPDWYQNMATDKLQRQYKREIELYFGEAERLNTYIGTLEAFMSYIKTHGKIYGYLR